jgi:predicted nucleotidyltransferase
VSGHYTEAEAETIRSYVRATRSRRKRDLADRLLAARRDCERIVQAVGREYAPVRIFQWGSLIDGRHFSEMSDIDLALEGITDPTTLSAIRAVSEGLTRFAVDIVAIEHIHPAYADHIRRRGRVVYGR